MIGLVILLFILFIIWGGRELFELLEEGTPASDSDILEMLELNKGKYYLERNWESNFELKARSYDAEKIVKTRYSILFPYYINNVGVIPVWYKSVKVLNQMFEEQIVNSRYKITKRDKLGLK
jgi:hypothetical protein